ncbi:hypothetical protein BDY19DRAFT_908589 [Irpex rosettiformis]|uniref:Uncharacterized protein n=1 Tax=Irpex rosettiformis TaxID=378272 RepID=A0ACB8TW40_9APHY|nr:hypothetical protein BDY19DRAFT_908589 [Irpex rosettiformis]
MKYIFALVSAVLLVGEATASAVVDRSFKQYLQARQNTVITTVIDPNSIIPECRATCAAMVAAFNNCAINSCLCTTPIVQATDDCLSCSISVPGNPSQQAIDSAQQALNGFEDSCKDIGQPVTSLTVSVITSVTAAGSATNTAATVATISATATTTSGTQASHTANTASAAAVSDAGSPTPVGDSASGGVFKVNGGVSSLVVAAVVGGVMLVMA